MIKLYFSCVYLFSFPAGVGKTAAASEVSRKRSSSAITDEYAPETLMPCCLIKMLHAEYSCQNNHVVQFGGEAELPQ